MATIGSLILGFYANLKPLLGGFAVFDARMAKFQKSLAGKLIGAGAMIRSLTTLTGTFADALEKASQKGADLGASLREAFSENVKSFPVVGDLARIVTTVRDEISGEAAELRAIEARLKEVQSRAGPSPWAVNRANTVADVMGDLRQQLEALEQTSMADKFAAQIQRMLTAMARPEQFRMVQDLQERIEDLTAAQAAAAKQAEALADAQDRAKSIMTSLLTPTEQIAKRIDEINKLFFAGQLPFGFWIRGLQQAAEELEKLKTVSDDMDVTSRFRQSVPTERRFVAGTPFGGGGSVASNPVERNTRDTATATKRLPALVAESNFLLRQVVTQTQFEGVSF